MNTLQPSLSLDEYADLLAQWYAIEKTEPGPLRDERMRILAERLAPYRRQERTNRGSYLLDYENVAAFARSTGISDDPCTITNLVDALGRVRSQWRLHLHAEWGPTPQGYQQQITNTASEARVFAQKLRHLPDEIQQELDERLQEYLSPDLTVWNFIELIAEILPSAANSFIAGKQLQEDLGYKPHTKGRRANGPAYRAAVNALADVWAEHAPDKGRANATKDLNGQKKLNKGGHFVAAALRFLSDGHAPQLTPSVMYSIAEKKRKSAEKGKEEWARKRRIAKAPGWHSQ